VRVVCAPCELAAKLYSRPCMSGVPSLRRRAAGSVHPHQPWREPGCVCAPFCALYSKLYAWACQRGRWTSRTYEGALRSQAELHAQRHGEAAGSRSRQDKVHARLHHPPEAPTGPRRPCGSAHDTVLPPSSTLRADMGKPAPQHATMAPPQHCRQRSLWAPGATALSLLLAQPC